MNTFRASRDNKLKTISWNYNKWIIFFKYAFSESREASCKCQPCVMIAVHKSFNRLYKKWPPQTPWVSVWWLAGSPRGSERHFVFGERVGGVVGQGPHLGAGAVLLGQGLAVDVARRLAARNLRLEQQTHTVSS